MNIDKLKKEIEDYLERYFKDKGTYNKYLYEAQFYSISNGGKRIRPILILLSYSMYKENYKDIVEFASAMEMIHTSSLIHDDLPAMDNDDLRRGKPTNHKVFGEAMAILAGDSLLIEAMIVMMDFSLRVGGNSLLASLEIAKASGVNGMMGGQAVDLLSEGKKEIGIEELTYMHQNKTGELIRSAIVAGAILGGSPEEDIQKLNKFGKNIGLVFQIKDDILDVTGDAKKLGKNINMDKNQEKCNFITIYGLERCQEICKKISKESIQLLDELTVNAKGLKELTIKLLEREN